MAPNALREHLRRMVKVVVQTGEEHIGLIDGVSGDRLTLRRAPKDGGGEVTITIGDIRDSSVFLRGS